MVLNPSFFAFTCCDHHPGGGGGATDDVYQRIISLSLPLWLPLRKVNLPKVNNEIFTPLDSF